MAQTVDDIAEILNEIRVENAHSVKGFDKILTAVDGVMQKLASDNESTEMMTDYLNDIRTLIEENHGFSARKISELELSLKNILAKQDNVIKTNEMKDIFAILSANINNFSTEIYGQKDIISNLNKSIEDLNSDNANAEEMVSGVAKLKEDLQNLREGYETSAQEIGSNVSEILKRIIMLDVSDQNDIIKRELENIYVTSNAVLSSLQIADQKNDSLSKTLEQYGEMLSSLKTILAENSGEQKDYLNEKIAHLEAAFANIITDDNFSEFKQELADFVQKVIDNSAILHTSISEYKPELEFIKEKLNSLAGSSMETDVKLGNTLSEIEELKTEIERFSDMVNSANVRQEGRFDVINDTMCGGLDECKESLSDILIKTENLKTSVSETSLSNRETIIGYINDAYNRTESLINSLKNSSNGIADELREEVNNLLYSMDGIKEEFKNTAGENVNSIISHITNEFDKAGEVLEQRINDLKEALADNSADENITDKIHILSGMIENSASDYDNKLAELKTFIGEYAQNADRIAAETDVKLGNSISEITGIKSELTNILDVLNSSSYEENEKLTEISGTIAADFSDILSKITRMQDLLQTGLNDDFQNIISALDEKFENLLSFFEVFKNVYTSDVKDNIVEIADKVSSLKDEISLVSTDILDAVNSKNENLPECFDELKETINNLNQFDFSEEFNEIKTLLSTNNACEIDNSELISRISELDVSIENKLNSALAELKIFISNIEPQKVDNTVPDEITDNLAALHQKIDLLVELDDMTCEPLQELLEKVDEISMRLEGSDKANQMNSLLKELLDKIGTIEKGVTEQDLEKNADYIRESIINSVVAMFDQITFSEETVEIKDFVEIKTEEINRSLQDVKNALQQITSTDSDYSYSLQDIESDIAKLRLVLNDISVNASPDTFNEITGNINKIASAMEDLGSALTTEQVAELKDNFEYLKNDVMSISNRTNQLLLTSDESYKMLTNSLESFSNVVNEIEEKVSDLSINKIERRLDEVAELAIASANSGKVLKEAMMYMGEWIDNTSENISGIAEKTSEIDEVKFAVAHLGDKLEKRFEEQETRIDRLERTLEKLMSVMEEKDNSDIMKKFDKIEKQLSMLGSNVEKLASYVDEE